MFFHHKLYEAVSVKRESFQLQGEIQTAGINLKGIRSGNMPRISKVRGNASAYREISTRHLQGYLDFFAYCKNLGYRIEKTKAKTVHAYKNLAKEMSYIHVRDFCKLDMPIDLFKLMVIGIMDVSSTDHQYFILIEPFLLQTLIFFF